MLRLQQRHLQRLLAQVWRRSPFYREYYTGHGIREEDLRDVSVADLPLLPKKILIDNFDRAVTDARLRRADVEDWLNHNRNPRDSFCSDTIVLHGSGTSGDIGIFAYDHKAWTIADIALAAHLPLPENYPNGKTRIAFYISTSGHFATVSTASSMPDSVYETLLLSLLEPSDRTVQRLNEFQPHRLNGYASCVAQLAELALEGRLRIRPQRIFVHGDVLTGAMERQIRAAWNAPIYILYACAESKFMAIRTPGSDQLTVLDDLNVLEVLDERDRPVAAEQEGRVVLTNLYNSVLPILRYELGDYVRRGTSAPDAPFTTLREIRGRVNDALPVVRADGQPDTIHPLVLDIQVPTVDKVQYVSLAPDHIRIDYVAPQDMEAAVRQQFDYILREKTATGTIVDVRRVSSIANDPKTGKFRLVRFEGWTRQSVSPGPSPSRTADVRRVVIKPARSFVPFDRQDVERSIPTRFEQLVEKVGHRSAVEDGDVALTYTELNRAANTIAHAILARRGPGQEPVALVLPGGAPAAAAILGILKAGKWYVPLDVSHPAGRLAQLLEEAQTPLLLTDNAHLSLARSLARDSGGVVNVDVLNVDALDAALPDVNPGLAVPADAFAYLLYTSGSTGRPKGVVQTHRNVLHQMMLYINALKLTSEDRVTQLHSHAFSASRLDIFGALLSGAALCSFPIAAEGIDSLARWLNSARVTVFHWFPTGFRRLVDAMNDADLLPDLRLIVLGSESLLGHDVELYKRHFSSTCVLVNRYGSTETGNISCHVMDKQSAVPAEPMPVGYAVDDVVVTVLDESGRELGRNQIGEIAVRSAYLSPGYWRRPDLTSEAFSPASGSPRETVYRTGDLGQLLADGCLLHFGRKDSQVKVRGYRVELGEVERTLMDHPAVTASAVSTWQEGAQDARLVAYYVAGDGPAPAPGSLRTFLESRLPVYMVPAAFVQLDALPVTPNGKVERAALPSPVFLIANAAAGIEKPQTNVERALADIWSSVLGVGAVGVNDNFFDLGGHSLHAMTIISRVAETLAFHVSLPEFFESPTIARMAEMIGAADPRDRPEGDLAADLSWLESLSEEQARQLLEGTTEERDSQRPFGSPSRG